MTDRELLELAAKAAGIDGIYDTDFDMLMLLDSAVVPTMWNPLKSDGDALRLAVQLSINIEHMFTLQRNRPAGINCWPVGRGDLGVRVDGNDSHALRQAIVLVAAGLGEAKP